MTPLLEIDTSTPSGIFLLIIGILCFPVVLYLFSFLYGYIFGGMARLTNRRIVRHGRTIADPNTIDALNKDVKEKLYVARKGLKQATAYIEKQINNKQEKNLKRKMEEIEQLKENGKISENEYSNLRAEILKKHYS